MYIRIIKDRKLNLAERRIKVQENYQQRVLKRVHRAVQERLPKGVCNVCNYIICSFNLDIPLTDIF